MSPTMYANLETGEISETSVKDAAVESAQKLVDEVWAQIGNDYNVGALTSLKIAEKVVNAVLSGTVREHCDILAEPLRPKQTRMPGMD